MINPIATRLSSLAMTTSSTSSSPEHLLLIFPFPKPTALLNALSTRHPYLKITYVELTRDCTKDLTNQPQVPDSLFADATILSTLFSFPSTPALAKNLKFIHLISTGSNQVQNKRIWKETDVVITTNSGIHSPMISEWVVLQMLTHSHKQKLLLKWQKEHFWGPHAAVQERSDYVGQRIGVLGYGSIGRQAAVIAKAMGMEVYAYTATPRTTPKSKHDNAYIVPGTGDPTGSIPTKWFSGLDKRSLHTFLSSNLDVLLISLPLTAATHHFISTTELELLSSPGSPPSPSKQKLGGTFIANISRGQIIDQVELERFCREGKLRGAALDVTDSEPLPKESGLWDIEGVAVTPHISGLSLAYIDRSLQILELNLDNLKTGKKLINIVDREKGY